MQNKWENPFLTVEPRYRTTIELPEKVSGRIKGIDPKEGVIQITVSILIAKLINELDRLKLTSYSPDEYRYAVANASLTLADGVQRSAVAVTPPGLQHSCSTEAANRDVGRGMPSVAPEAPRPQESADAPSAPKKQRAKVGKKSE
jgi:hypothetical protein